MQKNSYNQNEDFWRYSENHKTNWHFMLTSRLIILVLVMFVFKKKLKIPLFVFLRQKQNQTDRIYIQSANFLTFPKWISKIS